MTCWGSIRHGMGLHILGLPNPHAVPTWGVRRILRWMFSTLGIVFEMGIFPSLIITFLIRVRRRVDVFIGEGPWEVAFGLFLRTVRYAGIVVYDDIDYTPGFQPISGIRRRMTEYLERLGVRRADIVVSVSDRLANLRRLQGAQNVHMIPNGVNVNLFSTACRKRKTFHALSSTLMYMGYLGSWAGVDLLLEAVAIALQKIQDLRMIVLGHGTPLDIETFRKGICDKGLENVVDFRGEVPYEKLPDHLAEAHIGLAMFRPLDFTRYAFPLKVVEYMAAGLVVLTTVDTEAADLVTRSGAGEAVQFDAEAVAGAIIGLFADQGRYRYYAENAESFGRSYEWEKLMGQYFSLLNAHYASCVQNKKIR